MSQQKEEIKPHPDNDQLVAFAEAPDALERNNVRHHLTTCVSCRKQVASFQKTLQALRETPLPAPLSQEGHPDEMEIAEYINKTLSSEEEATFKQHLQECSTCTENTLYHALYTSDRTAPAEKAAVPISPAEAKEGEQPRRSSLIVDLLTWRIPAWIGLPAIALAALLIFLTLRPQAEDRITSYQEEPGIVFIPSEGLPGIGFFEAAREQSRSFGGMRIRRVEAKQLLFSWFSIEGALEYQIRIYTIANGKRILLAEASTKEKTEVILEMPELMPTKGYQWELTGKAKEDKRFIATGGFSMEKPH